MTDEELDAARGEEAQRLTGQYSRQVAIAAARLARTGWTPVDKDLIEARQCAALVEEGGEHFWMLNASAYRAGNGDRQPIVQSALIAIKRAKGRG